MTKLKVTAVAAALLVGVGTTVIVSTHEKTYTPTGSPDPSKVLQEARDDRAAGRFPDALSKHVWYHQNALKYQASQRGVRLSFALGDWNELGQKYPPALKKMKSLRDEASEVVRDNPQELNIATEAFAEVSGFNRVLKEERQTTELFRWVHSHNTDLAKRVFRHAEEALVKDREYTLYGRYIDAKGSYAKLAEMYATIKEVRPGNTNSEFDKIRLDAANRLFSYKAATLVALLALNNRGEEADYVAKRAAEAWNDPAFLATLNEARNGVIPEPAM